MAAIVPGQGERSGKWRRGKEVNRGIRRATQMWVLWRVKAMQLLKCCQGDW